MDPVLFRKIDDQIGYYVRRFKCAGRQIEPDLRQDLWEFALKVLSKFDKETPGNTDGLFSYLGKAFRAEVPRILSRNQVVKSCTLPKRFEYRETWDSDRTYSVPFEEAIDAKRMLAHLSQRHHKVLDCRLQGMNYREIAKRCGRLRSYVDHTCKQLRLEALAIQAGQVELDSGTGSRRQGVHADQEPLQAGYSSSVACRATGDAWGGPCGP